MIVSSVRDVVEGGFCVGCGGCAVASNGAIRMRLNALGAYEADLPASDARALDAPAAACPFSDAAPNEDVLAEGFAAAAPDHDPRIGHHSLIAAARITDEDAIRSSSSGGLTTWLLERLLETGAVDGVIHVGRGETDRPLFEYTVSYAVAELKSRRKSIYHSTEMSQALAAIAGDGKRYALVGIPCFVKAAALLMRADSRLAQQIRYRIGLICGHMKTAAFAESIAWQAGVVPGTLAAIDFRVKDPDDTANRYRFAVLRRGEDAWTTRRAADTLGQNWSHGMFQLGACDFCDDIFAETADVCLGDAWLPRYERDWRGTNIVVSRNADIDALLREGHAAGTIVLEELGVDDVAASQAGNFRHRWDGLSLRLADDVRRGRPVPRKRIAPGSRNVPALRRVLLRLRRTMSRRSHTAFAAAKATGRFDLFSDAMTPLIARMRFIYRVEALIRRVPMLQAIARRLRLV